MNQAEWARAKDELKTVGSGLATNDHKYQNEFKAAKAEAAKAKADKSGGDKTSK